MGCPTRQLFADRDTGSAPIDNYNQPYLADGNWFEGLDKQVKDIFVWGGSGELLIDSIEHTTKIIQGSHPRVDLHVEHNGYVETIGLSVETEFRGIAHVSSTAIIPDHFSAFLRKPADSSCRILVVTKR